MLAIELLDFISLSKVLFDKAQRSCSSLHMVTNATPLAVEESNCHMCLMLFPPKFTFFIVKPLYNNICCKGCFWAMTKALGPGESFSLWSVC